ncbi:Protein FAR1-RELATED SEQUENCE 5 [Abeliophyllum distichum]|uniref:Protein FAR1-RELATED SEQUENCE n=1 Tax=Abeliophyllum distichum TaxID=126358 RepID=A0ABD1PBR5_9LAMI
MSSSQRSESGHSFFKRYVNRKNSLMDFIIRFNMALRHQRHEELVANHVDISEQPRLLSQYQMENQMVNIYTKKIFLLFQKEIDESHFYICTKKSTHVDSKVYGVERREYGKTFDRQRQLTYYMETNYISCSCRSFEFNGYPCRHMISYLRKKQVLLLPEKYIVGRWTKNAKMNSCNYGDTGLATNESSSTSLMGRHGLLAHKASLIVDEGALTSARSTFLMDEFESLHLRVKEIDDGGHIGSMRHNTTSRVDSCPIHDPSAVRAKGCGKRLKSSKEKSMSKGNRQCRTCGQNGHDKRTCPKRNERPTTDMDTQGEDSNVGTHAGQSTGSTRKKFRNFTSCVARPVREQGDDDEVDRRWEMDGNGRSDVAGKEPTVEMDCWRTRVLEEITFTCERGMA